LGSRSTTMPRAQPASMIAAIPIASVRIQDPVGDEFGPALFAEYYR
jgi:hypothetical protein